MPLPLWRHRLAVGVRRRVLQWGTGARERRHESTAKAGGRFLMYYGCVSCPRGGLLVMPEHVAVMGTEVLAMLGPRAGGRYLDCTFGGGGHTRMILDAAPDTEVVALDADPAATGRAEALSRDYPDRFSFYPTRFSQLESAVHGRFAGVLFDLGVSSFQLDEGERGFSFRTDAPVDMRMNPAAGLSGADFLETATEDELAQAIRDYGEERRWRRVVGAIVRARGTGQLSRTGSLSELISGAVGTGKPGRPSRIHPATRSFQGIRIAVNEELRELETALPAAMRVLQPGGVLAVISFHSLEDRIVKRFFRRMAGKPESASDSLPQQFRERCAVLLTNRPLEPGETELRENARSRSAKLRALRKERDCNELH